MDGWTDASGADGWIHAWLDGQMDGWADDWMDGRMNISAGIQVGGLKKR